MSHKKLILAAVILVVSQINLAWAYDDYSPAEMSRTNPMAASGRKLGRGVSNMLTGWVELPRGVETVGRESGFMASLTWGVLQGAGTALARTAAGAAEIATFPIRTNNDEPIIEPEYLV